jgi:hypothetical protein
LPPSAAGYPVGVLAPWGAPGDSIRITLENIILQEVAVKKQDPIPPKSDPLMEVCGGIWGVWEVGVSFLAVPSFDDYFKCRKRVIGWKINHTKS